MITVSEKMLKAGADLFSVNPASALFVERGGAPDGAVYECPPFFLKFVPTAADRIEAVRDKMAFARYLRENGVRVMEFVPSKHDDLLEVLEEDGEMYAVSMSRRAPGRHLDPGKDFTPTFFQAWGQLIGQMHVLAKRYEGGEHINTWKEEHTFFAGWCQDDGVREKWQQLGDVLSGLPQDRVSFGLIHNDAHIGNIFTDSSGLTMLDFDVCNHHWFMTDIGIALFHPIWERQRYVDPAAAREFAHMFSQNFMEGYCRANSLSRFWLDQLPTFLRYRQILFFIAMSGEGNPDLDSYLAPVRDSILNDTPITDIRL